MALYLLADEQRNLSEVRKVNFYFAWDGAVWYMIERHDLAEYLIDRLDIQALNRVPTDHKNKRKTPATSLALFLEKGMR